jgi:hypothetical protein
MPRERDRVDHDRSECVRACDKVTPAESIGGVRERGRYDRRMRSPLTALPMWTVVGCTLPVMGLFVGLLTGPAVLAVAALVAGLFAPSLGHVVYRRVLLTRGFKLRLAVSAVIGLLVASGRHQRDLGTALGLMAVAVVLLLVGFVTGMILDLIDADRAAKQ